MSKLKTVFLLVLIVINTASIAIRETGSAGISDRELIDKITKLEHKIETMEKEKKQREEDQLFHNNLRDTLLKDVSKRVTVIEEKLKERTGFPIIAFRATHVENKAPSIGQVFIFYKVILNEGSGYDAITGKFTAPESGIYQFDAHFCNVAQVYVHCAIMKDGDRIASSKQGDSDNDTCSSVIVLVRLNKGNKVWVETMFYTDRIQDDDYRRNSFQGVLLHR